MLIYPFQIGISLALIRYHVLEIGIHSPLLCHLLLKILEFFIKDGREYVLDDMFDKFRGA